MGLLLHLLAETSQSPVDPNTLIVALIVGVPATVAAYASIGAKRESAGANRAVNHQDHDQPTLVQKVDLLAEELSQLTATVGEHGKKLTAVRRETGTVVNSMKSIRGDLTDHLAFHQTQYERRTQR